MNGFADWHRDLTTAAVLGTDRRPPPQAPPGFTAPADADMPTRLLDQAALAAALVRGGRTSGSASPLDPAPPETTPYAPEAALQRLRTLLDAPPVSGELRFELLLRWLRTAAHRSVIVPPEHIPVLAAFTAGRPDLRSALAAVWGERGRWLAPRLRQAAAAAAVASEVVDIAQRWPTLSARDKEQVLRTHDVSALDEAFLEACLDERAARVRDAARDLLAARPDSAFARRMADRLRPLVEVDAPRRRLFGSTTPVVRVRPPASIDTAAVRDGLPGTATDGDRTTSLRAVVRAAPLASWTSITGLEPDHVVQALVDDATVIAGLAAAAVVQRDARWAAALMAATTPGSPHPGLIDVIDPTDREGYVLARLTLAPPAEFVGLLDLAATPWSTAVGAAVLDRLATPSSDAGWAAQPSIPSDRAARLPASLVGRARVMLDDPVPATDKPAARTAAGSRARFLHAAVTFHAFDRSIQEGFA